jgi:hypothetical protein
VNNVTDLGIAVILNGYRYEIRLPAIILRAEKASKRDGSSVLESNAPGKLPLERVVRFDEFRLNEVPAKEFSNQVQLMN